MKEIALSKPTCITAQLNPSIKTSFNELASKKFSFSELVLLSICIILDHPGYCHNFQTFNLTSLYIKIEFNHHVSDFFISKCVTVVRRVDELGRIVIPIELRRTLYIAVKDALEIYVDGEMIILKKYEPACIFCFYGDARDVTNYKGKNICKNCMRELKTDK